MPGTCDIDIRHIEEIALSTICFEAIHEDTQERDASIDRHAGSGQNETKRRQNEEDSHKQDQEDCLSIMERQSCDDLLTQKANATRAAIQRFVRQQAEQGWHWQPWMAVPLALALRLNRLS